MLICFDLDGTLLATHYDISACMNSALASLEMNEIPLETIAAFRFSNWADFMEDVEAHMSIDKDASKLITNKYMEIYNQHNCSLSKIFDGIEEVIETLKRDGHIVGAISNKPEEYAEEELKYYFPYFQFDAIIGSRGDGLHKPDLVYYDRLQEKIGKHYDDFVYVGDSYSDYLFTRNCEKICKNAKFIGAGWGYAGVLRANAKEALILENPIDILRTINE